MSKIDLSLITNFVKSTKDTDVEYKPVYLYGTIVTNESGDVYVQPDGSNELAPVHVDELGTAARFNNGDRVILQIQNNELIVTGNITNPSMSSLPEDDLAAALSQLGITVEIGGYGIYLGKDDSDFSIVIDNDSMDFFQKIDGVNRRVAYVEANEFHMVTGSVVNTFRIGNYMYAPRDDGSMYLKWVGDERQESEVSDG